MTTHTIRTATIEDAPALVTFNLRLAKETEDMDLDPDVLRPGIETILSDPSRGFYVVAISQDQVVGATMVTKEWSDWRNADFWWIQSVYVQQEFRRQGIFRGLLDHIQAMSKAANICGFRLYVERENEVAQQTYDALGFDETVYKMFEKKL